MLRKRTSFKPNLKQVAPQQAPQAAQSLATNAPIPPAGQSLEDQSIGPADSAGKQQNESVINNAYQLNPSTLSGSTQSVSQNIEQQAQSIVSPTLTLTAPANPTKDPKELCNITSKDGSTNQSSVHEVPDMSNQRVQEAITQLTGQKFEPIKSLSLRSSANKNVKLKDLLFFNPPMTKDQKRHKKSVSLAKKSEQKKSQTSSEEDSQQQTPVIEKTSNYGDAETTDTTDTLAEEHSLVPKVKMGPEGKLILDESSTIINRKNLIKEQEAIVEDNEDVISRTNYDSFRRRPTNISQTKWSLEDTKKFYHALTILGTDFSMMESLLFSGLRSRTELHKKFKREERVNKLKIDIALSNRISLNSEELEDLRKIFYKQ